VLQTAANCNVRPILSWLVPIMSKILDFCISCIMLLYCISHAGSQSPYVHLIAPNGNEHYSVGTDVTVIWYCDTGRLNAPAVEYSWDKGLAWAVISDDDSVQWDTLAADTFGFTWTVPDSLLNFANFRKYSAVSNQALIRITQYSDYSISDVSDKPFIISSAGNSTGNLSLRVVPARRTSIKSVYLPNGRSLHTANSRMNWRCFISPFRFSTHARKEAFVCGHIN
jgi:hypothetical protein